MLSNSKRKNRRSVIEALMVNPMSLDESAAYLISLSLLEQNIKDPVIEPVPTVVRIPPSPGQVFTL